MRSKTPLLLLEITVLLLVFAAASVLCLQTFLLAERESAENLQKDAALIALQNAAEQVKGSGCPMAETTALENGLEVRRIPVESGVPGLGKARVAVFLEEECLMECFVCWQEAVVTLEKDN